jgi:hypothetical protein
LPSRLELARTPPPVGMWNKKDGVLYFSRNKKRGVNNFRWFFSSNLYGNHVYIINWEENNENAKLG